MNTLRRRIEALEQTADDGTGGGWEILIVELTDDGPDEETAIELARAAALAEGRHVMPVTGGKGGPSGRVQVSMVIVDMRTDKTNDGGFDNGN